MIPGLVRLPNFIRIAINQNTGPDGIPLRPRQGPNGDYQRCVSKSLYIFLALLLEKHIVSFPAVFLFAAHPPGGRLADGFSDFSDISIPKGHRLASLNGDQVVHFGR